MEQTWTVVLFKDENTVEAVPTSWIINDMCFWPALPNEKLMSAIRKNDQPNTCWPMFKVKLFRNSTFDDYMTARAKSKKAECTSDLNSDSEAPREVLPTRSQRNARRRISSDSDYEYEWSESLTLPSPPKLQSSSASATVATRPKAKKRAYENLPILDTVDQVAAGIVINGPVTTTTEHRCCCCPVHGNYGDLLKDIWRKQNLNNQFLKQVSGDVAELNDKRDNFNSMPNGNNNNVDKPSIFNKCNLPADTDEDIIQLEDYLAIENNLNITVQELSKLGGKTLYGFIQRTMCLLITNKMASNYSWHGKRLKRPFKGLHFAKLLITSAQLTFERVTIIEVEEGIKKWLRRAKERNAHAERNNNNNNGEVE